MESIGGIVFTGPLVFALPIALLAGVVAFASPCVLPLLPGYLGFIGGFADSSETSSFPTLRLVSGVVLFILGFSAVFISFSVVSARLGAVFLGQKTLILMLAGFFLVALGFVFIGRFRWLQRSFRFSLPAVGGFLGAPVLGMIFGLGWAPCLGPTLVAVNALAFSVGDTSRAVLLACAYCLGLGLPFVLAAAGFAWSTKALFWVKKNIRQINLAGGLMLISIGFSMIFGLWQVWMATLQGVIGGVTTSL